MTETKKTVAVAGKPKPDAKKIAKEVAEKPKVKSIMMDTGVSADNKPNIKVVGANKIPTKPASNDRTKEDDEFYKIAGKDVADKIEENATEEVAKAVGISKEEVKDITKKQNEAAEEAAKEAAAFFGDLMNFISNGAVQVYIKKPRRKGDEYETGRVVSINTDLVKRQIKVKVAYTVGRQHNVEGKKRYVPTTDIFTPDQLYPYNIIDVDAEYKAEAERIAKLKEEKKKALEEKAKAKKK